MFDIFICQSTKMYFCESMILSCLTNNKPNKLEWVLLINYHNAGNGDNYQAYGNLKIKLIQNHEQT